MSPQAWVAGDTGNQRAEHGTDTDTGTSKTNGSETGSDLLTGFDESVGELGGVWAEGLTGQRANGGGLEDLLTLGGLERRLGGVVILKCSSDA